MKCIPLEYSYSEKGCACGCVMVGGAVDGDGRSSCGT